MWMTLWRLSLSFLFITSRIFSSTRAWWWNLQNYRLHVKILENLIFVFIVYFWISRHGRVRTKWQYSSNKINGRGLWNLFYTFLQFVFSEKEFFQENQYLKSFDFFLMCVIFNALPGELRWKTQRTVLQSSAAAICRCLFSALLKLW